MTLDKIKLVNSLLIASLLLGSIITSCHFFVQKMTMEMEHGNTSMVMFSNSDAQAPCCQLESGQSHIQNNIIDVIKKVSVNNLYFELIISLFFVIFGSLLSKTKIIAIKFYYLKHLFTNFYNFLVQIFSEGILNPQIYNA